MRRLYDNRDPRSLASWLRRRRMRRFATMLRRVATPDGRVRILDVGGTPTIWNQGALDGVGSGVELTILNLEMPAKGPANDGYRYVVGDARDLTQYDDDAFDVVFSNSVLEHVGSRNDQQRMANEVCRVGRRHFVQTPSYWFPIEPHFVFPCFQYLPLELRARIHRRLDLGWVPKEADLEHARRDVAEIRLLGARALRRLFPGSRIVRERFLGVTKSLIALGGRWDEHAL